MAMNTAADGWMANVTAMLKAATREMIQPIAARVIGRPRIAAKSI
jgi:hypothetical protein